MRQTERDNLCFLQELSQFLEMQEIHCMFRTPPRIDRNFGTAQLKKSNRQTESFWMPLCSVCKRIPRTFIVSKKSPRCWRPVGSPLLPATISAEGRSAGTAPAGAADAEVRQTASFFKNPLTFADSADILV